MDPKVQSEGKAALAAMKANANEARDSKKLRALIAYVDALENPGIDAATGDTPDAPADTTKKGKK